MSKNITSGYWTTTIYGVLRKLEDIMTVANLACWQARLLQPIQLFSSKYSPAGHFIAPNGEPGAIGFHLPAQPASRIVTNYHQPFWGEASCGDIQPIHWFIIRTFCAIHLVYVHREPEQVPYDEELRAYATDQTLFHVHSLAMEKDPTPLFRAYSKSITNWLSLIILYFLVK